MNKLNLIPYIEYVFPENVSEELSFIDGFDLDSGGILYVDWDEYNYPEFQTFLLKEYGNECKKYEYFAISQMI